MRVTFKPKRLLPMLAAVALTAGCANLGSGIDKRLDTALDKFCPIPEDTPQNHVIRAHMALAAITGYAYRSVQNYSKPREAGDDATRAITRINAAYKTLNATSVNSGIYPIELADTRIDLAEAAEAAISPTLRAGKISLTGSVTDRVSLMKTAMIAFLEDGLYLQAYRSSCINFSRLNIAEIDARTRKRCADLEDIGSIKNGLCQIR